MKRPPRVVHVVSQLSTGGMEKLLVEFARHGDRAAFAPHVVSLGGRGPVAEEVEAVGCPVTALGMPPGLRPALVVRLARLFRFLRADVVHAHNTRPLIYAAPAAKLAGARAVVHTRHGQRYGVRPRETALFRLAARLADRLVAVSHDGAALSREEGVPPRKVRTIWNGIDLDRFAYAGPAAGGPAVFVGRLSPEKDVATLLRAAALAAQARPDFRLEVAGDGPCLGELRQLAGVLDLGRNVRFLGEVRDVPALLSRASVFVLSSLTEGISLTILEAMARGLPVVTTWVGGNPEVVENNVTGLLVPARSPVHLADAMLHLTDHRDAALRMGRAGRRRVRESFEARRMVAEYEGLYAEVLGRMAKAARGPAPVKPRAAGR